MTCRRRVVTVLPVRTRLAHLRGLRPSVLAVDCALAVATTLGLELETWLGGNAQGHRTAVAALGPLVTCGVAVRRRYPTACGVGAGLHAVVLQAVWPSAVLSYAVAW